MPEAVVEPFKGLEPIGDTPVAPGIGIGAIALNMAMQYHNINTIQDGMLYQQYKLEGKNMEPLHLDMVFETAIKIEMHLLGASDRIAKIVVDCVKDAIIYDDNTGNEENTDGTGDSGT